MIPCGEEDKGTGSIGLVPFFVYGYDVHRQLLTPINRAMSMGITHFLAILRGGFFYP